MYNLITFKRNIEKWRGKSTLCLHNSALTHKKPTRAAIMCSLSIYLSGVWLAAASVIIFQCYPVLTVMCGLFNLRYWTEKVSSALMPPPPRISHNAECLACIRSVRVIGWVLLQLRSGGGPFTTVQASLPDWDQLWSSAQIADDVG